MQHLLNLSLAELRQWLADQGLPAYRAAQIHKWIYEKRAGTFDEMSDLPKDLRERLAAEFTIFSSTVSAHKIAEDGTEKLLLEWPDGHRIECVLIREAKAPIRLVIAVRGLLIVFATYRKPLCRDAIVMPDDFAVTGCGKTSPKYQ